MFSSLHSKDLILCDFPFYLQMSEHRDLVQEADFQRHQLIVIKIPEMTRYQGKTSHASQRIDTAS